MGYGGASGGSGSIASSSDVALNGPTDSQVLAYDGTTSKWKNQTIATGGTDLTTVGIGSGANQIDGFWQGTQAEYDAIGTKDPATLYDITDAAAPVAASNPWEFRVEDYGAVGDNSTDDTTAIISAVNAAVTYAKANNYYAEVIFKPVTYLLSSATTKGGATLGNAQIPLPYIDPTVGQKVVLAFKGSKGSSAFTHWNQTVPQMAGTTLRSTLTGLSSDPTWGAPSVLGGITVAQGTPKYSNMMVVIDGISVVAPYNPGIIGVDLKYIAQAEIISLGVRSNAPAAGTAPLITTKPTNSLGIGLRMPVDQNNDESVIIDYACEGFYYGLTCGEHTSAQRIACVYVNIGCFLGSPLGNNLHGGTIQNLSVEVANTAIQMNGGATTKQAWDIRQISIESVSGPVIIDSNNALRGSTTLMQASGTGNPAAPTITGANFYEIKNLYEAAAPLTAPTVPATATPIQNTTHRTCAVTVTSGTVTNIKVGGTDIGQTSGTFIVPVGYTVELDYSAVPTWTWIAI